MLLQIHINYTYREHLLIHVGAVLFKIENTRLMLANFEKCAIQPSVDFHIFKYYQTMHINLSFEA